MEEVLTAQRSTTVRIKTLHGKWTFLATLTHVPSTEGITPAPKPHFPPFPVKAVIGAVEDMLMAKSGDVFIEATIEHTEG
jgi:hypothetical protein